MRCDNRRERFGSCDQLHRRTLLITSVCWTTVSSRRNTLQRNSCSIQAEQSCGSPISHLSQVEHSHGFPLESDAAQNSLGQAIENACKEVAGLTQVAGIWISGDLTWRARRMRSSSHAASLAASSHGRTSAIITTRFARATMTCGFSADPAAKESIVTVATDEAISAYADFYQHLFYIHDPMSSSAADGVTCWAGQHPSRLRCSIALSATGGRPFPRSWLCWRESAA